MQMEIIRTDLPHDDDNYSAFYYHSHLLANCLGPVKGSGHFILEAKIMPTFLLANENHSHPGCSTWNTPKKKMQKKLDFPKILARGRQCESQVFFRAFLKNVFQQLDQIM